MITLTDTFTFSFSDQQSKPQHKYIQIIQIAHSKHSGNVGRLRIQP